MSMNYDRAITRLTAWQDTTWTLTLDQENYFPTGSVIFINSELEVLITNPDSDLRLARQASYNPNGTLTWEGLTARTMISSSGEEIPEGTPAMFIMSMAIFEGAENHITALAVVDDPEDVAVIAAVEGEG